MGLPFIGIRGLLGTDILKHRPDLRVVQNPFNPGEDLNTAFFQERRICKGYQLDLFWMSV